VFTAPVLPGDAGPVVGHRRARGRRGPFGALIATLVPVVEVLMNRTITNSLTEAELALVRETDRDRLAGLDEDALADLHDRIRRARTKHVTIYRRTGAATVAAKGGRGVAKERNARNAAKAEVFEDALARVSRALAAAARASATALRAERVAAARSERSAGPRRGPGSGPDGTPASRPRAVPRDAPARRKRDASTLATGARRQARRDSNRPTVS
jgi:hypothetical protein